MNENKKVAWLYVFLKVSVILVMVAQFFNQNYYNVFLCLLALVMFSVPTAVGMRFKIKLPSTLEIIILLFIYSAVILGEIRNYYVNYKYWDTMLHTLNGFLMAAIGFSLVDILNRSNNVRVNLSPEFVALVAFSFSMTVGVLWEFFEFGMDNFFRLDMQKDTFLNTISSVAIDTSGDGSPVLVNVSGVVINSAKGDSLELTKYLDIGLYDTMKDLIVNFIGAVVFSTLGYIGIKNRENGRIVSSLVPRMKNQAEIDRDEDVIEAIKQKKLIKRAKKKNK